jgi:serine/threonine protein kinase
MGDRNKLPPLKCLEKYQVGELIYFRDNETRLFLASCGNEPFVLKIYTTDSWISREYHNPEALLHHSLRHPHICPIIEYYFEEFEQSFYLVIVEPKMDTDLDAEAKKRKKEAREWTGEELERGWRELVSGFAYAQERQIEHRDVKPANLFLHQGKFMIGDFGSAKISEAGCSGAIRQTFVGSLSFLSPELAEELPEIYRSKFKSKKIVYDAHRSDVYSLALSLLYLVNPKQVKSLSSYSDADGLVDDLPISPSLLPLFHRMLSITPSDRPDFLELQQLLGPGADLSMEARTLQQDSTILQIHNMLPNSPLATFTCEMGHEDPQPSFNSSESISQNGIPDLSRHLPTLRADYRKTAFTMTCVVCGKGTKLRQLDCMRHSICGQECKLRLEVLYMRGLGKQDCLICSGSSWEAEITQLTESLLPIAYCHHCRTYPLALNSLLYLICGGTLHLICSKSCLKSLYFAHLQNPSQHCALCRVPFNPAHIQAALLARSFLDLPAVPGLHIDMSHC